MTRLPSGVEIFRNFLDRCTAPCYDARMNPLLQLIILATLIEVEESRRCPRCGEELDSGMGFGRRDLECDDWDHSYDLNLYFDLMTDYN